MYRGEISHSNDLRTSLAKYRPEALTVDCFDTLLWRTVQEPSDVFLHLEESETFAQLGITASVRIEGEDRARRKAVMMRGTAEVNIEEIYHEILSESLQASMPLCRKLATEELEAELRFTELNRDLASALLEVREISGCFTVVSDTYFNKLQIKTLLNAAFSRANLVTPELRVFTSSDHGVDKNSLLLSKVCRSINVYPSKVLHIGDSRSADINGALKAGCQAMLFRQFSEEHLETRRSARNVMRLALGGLNEKEVASDELKIYDTPRIISAGRGLVPKTLISEMAKIYTHFALEIFDEASKIGASKILFMMRDAHLVGEIASICSAEKKVDLDLADFFISRYVANIVSLRSLSDIRDLCFWLCSSKASVADLERQFLLTPGTLQCAPSEILSPGEAYKKLSCARVSSEILSSAEEYREKFLCYLKNTVEITRGDKILLVDLGYEATIQRRTQSFLEDALGVEVNGIYLIGTFHPNAIRGRAIISGYGGARDVALILQNISVFEQLSMRLVGSTLSYCDNHVKHSRFATAKDQTAKILECQRLVRETVENALSHPDFGFPGRRGSAAEIKRALSRLLLAPTPHEQEFLQDFTHDINLGSDATVRISPSEKSSQKFIYDGVLHARLPGLSWIGDVRSSGYVTYLGFLAAAMSKLDIRKSDLRVAPSNITAFAFSTNGEQKIPLLRVETHRGFERLVCLVKSDSIAVGLILPNTFSLFQLTCAEVSLPDDVGLEQSDSIIINDQSITYDGLRPLARTVWELTAPNGLIVFEIPENCRDGLRDIKLSVVFRDLTLS